LISGVGARAEPRAAEAARESQRMDEVITRWHIRVCILADPH
jgi:hypothetical protein